MSKLFTLTPENLPELKQRITEYEKNGGMLVMILCAAWCGTCSGFQDAAENLAGLFPEMTVLWIDVEDNSDVSGEIDVMNFPSLAVFRDGIAVHYGVSLPHQGVVKRLLSALSSNPVKAADVPQEVLSLPLHLKVWLAASHS